MPHSLETNVSIRLLRDLLLKRNTSFFFLFFMSYEWIVRWALALNAACWTSWNGRCGFAGGFSIVFSYSCDRARVDAATMSRFVEWDELTWRVARHWTLHSHLHMQPAGGLYPSCPVSRGLSSLKAWFISLNLSETLIWASFMLLDQI